MNYVFAVAAQVLFAACAPALVASKFLWPKRISWWLVIVLAVLGGWLLVNAIVYFTQAHTLDLVMAAGGLDKAPPDLLERWSKDGGPKGFAIVLGWVSALIYLLPWLGLYVLANWIRRRSNRASRVAA
jgi:hypothetical protein